MFTISNGTQADGDALGVNPPTQAWKKKPSIHTPEDGIQLARAHVLALVTQGCPEETTPLLGAVTDTILTAASRASSIHDSCLDRAYGPSRRSLNRMLEDLNLAALEERVPSVLDEQLGDLLPSKFVLSIDLTDIPYHGQALDDERELVRSQPRDGTTWKHRYATAYVTREGQRFTLAVQYIRKGTGATGALEQLLDELAGRGWLERVRYVLVDKGFYSVRAIKLLREHDLGFVLPVPHKGKDIKRWCASGESGWHQYSVGNRWVETQAVRVAVVYKPEREESFAYAVDGVTGTPEQVDARYRKRGGIETSYKVMNQARPRTSSRCPARRLLFVVVSLVVQNAWVLVKQAAGEVRVFFRQFLRSVAWWVRQWVGFQPVLVGVSCEPGGVGSPGGR